MEFDAQLAREARVFGTYLIGEAIHDGAVELYQRAHQTLTFELDAKEKRLLALALNHPFWIGSIDGGLALLKRRSHLRKKLYYLLAILEASPHHAHKFISSESTWIAAIFRLAFFGVRAVFRALTGCLLYVFI